MYPTRLISKHTGQAVPAAVCSFCAQDLFFGDRVWLCGSLTACEDCFGELARLTLKPFELTLGEEEKHDTL